MAISSTNAPRGRITHGQGSVVSVRPQGRISSGQAGSAEVTIGGHLRDWKTLAGFGVSAAIIVFFVLTAHLDPGAIWANVRTADIRYLALGLVVYFGAFLFRGLRWRLLLRRADLGNDVHFPSLGGIIQMIYLSWFINCLVPAKLGDAYRSYLLRKHTNASIERTLGTVVGERMADILALAVLLCASGLFIAGSLAGAAGNLQTILVIGLGLIAAICFAIITLKRASGPLLRLLPASARKVGGRFVEGLAGTLQRDIQLPLYGYTCLIWAFKVLRMWLVMQSFHIVGLPMGVIVFTALAGSLLSTIPFTPAGLGAVEGASVAILTTFGVASGLAGAVAVMDRVINYWSNIPVGGLVYLFSRWK